MSEFLGDTPTIRSMGVNGTSTIRKGEIVMIDAQGYARPGALLATGTVRTRGVALADADNAAGADDAVGVRVQAGVHGPYANNGTSISIANCGAPCYVVDANTVDLADGGATRGLAGTIERVTSAGVFVFFA